MSGTLISIIIDLFIILSLLIGTFFIFSSSVGILRFPDVYTRLHAVTKGATLGVAGIMIGAFLFLFIEHGIISGKLILGTIFVFMTAPVSGHMISRAGYHNGVKLWDKSVRDDYADVVKEKRKSIDN
ncbi:Na(+)/H(+) antiporter subunit G [Thalassobacillus devorans]|uniref:Na(+)/H(+) antiporter subunit G n=1 Tax=Thalassobacillus devorans TaxID=279813 RepID=A0ABQ1P8F0_9BACI|nr:monovalent cation/H(+) antiporter subunit G [Thalassobacillus devorans]NIK29734.1 multicomponent Na+:H+ antiporter subunit G [Thalassobacillus devorans]GGC92375.1 Na(+)/H(+) antiporter subunit G [Thalassobacillus devorans]